LVCLFVYLFVCLCVCVSFFDPFSATGLSHADFIGPSKEAALQTEAAPASRIEKEPVHARATCSQPRKGLFECLRECCISAINANSGLTIPRTKGTRACLLACSLVCLLTCQLGSFRACRLCFHFFHQRPGIKYQSRGQRNPELGLMSRKN
jgi:hypothetical protein